MKIIVTSLVLVGAGSLAVNAEPHKKMITPSIIEKVDEVDKFNKQPGNNFIVLPTAECTNENFESLEESIKVCVDNNKTWLKAI
jgi:hypothetical protein